MRIPSQLNDDTLYGRRNRKSATVHSYRRLIRLTVALALVVVVIQQAGQPGMYEIFFGSPDVEPGQEQSMALGQTALSPDSSASNASVEIDRPPNLTAAQAREAELKAIPESIRLAAGKVTRAMSVNEQRQWIVVLDRWQNSEPFRVMEPVIESTIAMIDDLDDLPAEERLSWQESLKSFGGQYASADRIPPDSGVVDDESGNAVVETQVDSVAESLLRLRFIAWLAALDQAAADRVVDGAIWRSDDFDAFYRQLDQATELGGRGALAVAVVPLMQQPKTYLGKKVRVAGFVARSIEKEAASNPFGIKKYWELWVRPKSGGDRPFVLIVPQVSQKVAEVGSDASARKGPEIEVIGRFFKRLGYASSFGADAAPVVIGRISGLRPGTNGLAVASQSATKRRYAKTPPAVLSRLWKTLFLAVLFGGTIAGVAIWRCNVSARRSRAVRNDHRASPDAFLSDLAVRTDVTDHSEDTQL